MKLSIITINFNNHDGLQKTINSVIAQTWKDFEWIIIDGGSTDGSKNLIEQYDKYITYWISESDKGIYNAMNKGIKIARGDYLQFLNSGDYFYNEKVIEKFCNRNNIEDVIYGNAILVNTNGQELAQWIAPDILKLSYFWSHTLNHQALFFNKRCFNCYLYNENNKIASDVELFITLLYNHYSFAKYNEFIVQFNATGISSQKTGINEFDPIINRILPYSVRADYNDIIMFRDVDLAIMIKKIINSNKFFRHLTRIFLYPIYQLCKFFYN